MLTVKRTRATITENANEQSQQQQVVLVTTADMSKTTIIIRYKR